MSANERAIVEEAMTDKRIIMEIGVLGNAVHNQIACMGPNELRELSKHLTAYVLSNEVEGGPINDQVLLHTYSTLNKILGSGIVIPESLMNWSANA